MNEPPPKFLRVARQECLKSPSFYKLGCVIFKGNKVLGKGFNINKTHPKFGSGFASCIHAEGGALMNAISNTSLKKVRGSHAVVYRRNDNLAKPCIDCQELLKEYGIKRIHYTTGIGYEKISN